jgi:signal transduction histidine kinase
VTCIDARRVGRSLTRAPFTKSSWLATMQVLTGFAVAVIAFSVMLFLTAVGAIVLPTVVLVAVPFVALLACADVFTAWQRSRFAAFADIRIPEAPSVLPRSGGTLIADLLRAAGTLSTWRQIGYHLVIGPAIATVGAITVAVAWSGALVFATRPLQAWLAPGTAGHNAPKIGAVSLAGLIAFFVAPWIARAAAALDTAAAVAMLGPGRGEELARLTESRAGAVSAADAERRRIERDLHDGTQQRLVSMAMRLGLALATLENMPDDARSVIERAHEDAKDALKELRDLVQGMHPAILTDRGLDAALSGIAARAPLPVKLTVQLPAGKKLPAATEAVAFFIVSEALTNTAKHAEATEAMVTVSAVTVTNHGGNDVLIVTIEDDGHGGADPAGGTGLAGLRQRAASVDGTLYIHSPLGGPTLIRAELPCGW